MKYSHEYKTWIFDCDGVLLDSNLIKTEAFYEIGLSYCKEQADELVVYHKQFGGISRFDKFKYFFETILQRKEYKEDLAAALVRYSLLVKSKLMQCPEAEGLRLFLDEIPEGSRKIVVSGGLQSEVRESFIQRGLADYFDAIYGSPANKMEILQKEVERGLLFFPAVFIGDSKYDYESAKAFGIDFIFVSCYSEFDGWRDYFKDKDALIVSNLSDIRLKLLK
jgi:phosphoglycolate phosphatase-like HAD superfamily hydrolase